MISHSRELQRYCSEPLENIENYELAANDKEHMWDCHHRLEVQGQFRNSKELLKRCGMYWHRPASELVFLRHDEHRSLHHTGNKYWLGKSHSDETRREIAESSPRKKMVEMNRRSDGFTQTFSSQREAARWLRENGYPNATQGVISDCCRGERRSVYGAKWSFVS